MPLTSRERLETVLRGDIPDCVPVAPDISNMIPCRMTGKPFWDLYLHNDPPQWEAYIDAAKYFGFDALMDGYFPLTFKEELAEGPDWEEFIVFENKERIVIQESFKENGKRVWKETVDVYYIADPPTNRVKPEKVGLSSIPGSYKPLERRNKPDMGSGGVARMKELMGDHGLVGVAVAKSLALRNEDEILHYMMNPDKHEQWAQERVDAAEKRFKRIMAMPVKPDFLCVGASGTLVFQSLDIFKQLAFPAVKRAIELANEAGLPTHVHSCGPEKELVKLFAQDTNLTVIDPLEIAPMGDCDLKELKREYGDKIVLKGNLHTTQTMLMGSVEDVKAASRKAIDDAAEGGRFILSTGDQCGRDTPDENLFAMVETARTYGQYS